MAEPISKNRIVEDFFCMDSLYDYCNLNYLKTKYLDT